MGSVEGWIATHPIPFAGGVLGGAVLAIGLVVAVLSHRIVGYRVDDARTGKT